MKKNIVVKLFAVNIIFLFIAVSIISSACSFNNNCIEEENKSSDDEVEIISFIRGSARCFSIFSEDGFTRDVGIGGPPCDIDVFAITSFKPFRYYKDHLDVGVRIPQFVGYIYSPYMDYVKIRGIAIGNIDIAG